MKSFTRAATNIRRTPYQAMAAVMVLTITFFIGITISFAGAGIYQALRYFETRPQVLIFFSADAPESDINALQNDLQSHAQVTEVTYVPQEQALDIYQDLNKNDPILLELVTADILPASLEISTTDLDTLKIIADSVANASGVEEVVLRTEVVDLLAKWLSGIQYAGTVFFVTMTITSIMIIGIVVGMKIAGKHYEIQVLRLIGASPWYIQGPFLLEGAIYGVISAILAYILSISLLLYSTPLILSFSGEVPLLPTNIPTLAGIFGGSLLIGLFVGTFGSWLAVKRYLKK